MDEAITDAELVVRIKQGEERAFEEIFHRYKEKLYFFALRYLRNTADAEGMVQEIFTKVWLSREQLDPDRSFNAFLFTMTRNAIFNISRHKQYERAYAQYAKHIVGHVHEKSEEDIIYADLLKYVQEHIAQLPPKRKKIFQMSREQQLSYKEIAQELDISEKTVETHIRLALQSLRTALKNQYMLPIILLQFF